MSRLDFQELEEIATRLSTRGMADYTQRSYKSGQTRFIRFCKKGGMAAIPASESVLIHFVSHLVKDGLKHRTIKSYLSAVRFMHIAEEVEDPFKAPLHRLHYTMRGMKREEASRGVTTRERLPITPGILRKIRAIWEPRSQDPDIVMLWAAACLGFFGFSVPER